MGGARSSGWGWPARARSRAIHVLFENDGELEFCTPFPKFTALHRFATFCIETEIFEDMSEEQLGKVLKSKERVLPINRAMNAHGIEHTTLAEWLAGQERTRHVRGGWDF